MNKTTSYYGIQKVEYKFSRSDILDSLAFRFEIQLAGRDYTFEIFEEFEGIPEGAELVVNYKTADTTTPPSEEM